MDPKDSVIMRLYCTYSIDPGKIRAVAGQGSSPYMSLNLLKSMTHDLDLKVTRVGFEGTE